MNVALCPSRYLEGHKANQNGDMAHIHVPYPRFGSDYFEFAISPAVQIKSLEHLTITSIS